MLHTQNIKNIKEVAEQSDAGVRLYYSIAENAVYTRCGETEQSRWWVTEFSRKNTEEEITEIVNRWLSM